MKNLSWLFLFLIFVSGLWGQTPASSATPPPMGKITSPFGSSLDKGVNDDGLVARDEPIRVDSALILNKVIVRDAKGNVVRNLQKEDFNVVEDQVPQEIEVFETAISGEPSRSIVLVIGKSFDMPDIKTNIEAAKILVDDLRIIDRMAIVTTDLTLRSDFTNNKEVLKRTLDSIPFVRGWLGAMTFATLSAVLNEKFNENDQNPIVIVQGAISDVPLVLTGDDSLWNALGKAQKILKRSISFTDVEKTVERSYATVFNVITTPKLRDLAGKDNKKISSAILKAYGRMQYEFIATLNLNNGVMPDRSRFISLLEGRDNKNFFKWVSEHQQAVNKLATVSGGMTSYVETEAAAKAAYESLAEISRSRYTVGYSPKDQISPKRLRTISIQVKNHPDYTVFTRRVYFR